jgi:phage tail-like protein
VPDRPFTTFNFLVELVYGDNGQPICNAEFSEVSGLEINLEPKTLREGGNNRRPIHLVGQISYGQMTLKRGMTTDFGLWEWFETVQRDDGLGVRASGEVVMKAADGVTDQVRWVLSGCLPIKLKVPTLDAKEGAVAIEEMQIAYETLTRR